MPTQTALWNQDDGPAWGWGPFGGESAFVLLAGDLQVLVLLEDGADVEEREVSRLVHAGETVGETSLLANLPRSSTVRTVGPCLVAEVSRAAMERAVDRPMSELAHGVLEFISERRMEGLVVEIGSRFLSAISETVILKRHKRIVRQGAEGDSMLVVVRGQLKVLLAFQEGEQPREVGRLRAGDAIGEMVLLLGHPFAATAQVASRECTVARISREASASLFAARPQLAEALATLAEAGGGGMRARTPLGGRAATPGGMVAQGLSTSQGVVTYPWAPQEKGMHVEERGGRRYLAGLAAKVTNALLGRIEGQLAEQLAARSQPFADEIEEASHHLAIAS
ncbi:hypothetical protein T484DRAFT_1813332 [Baffinella frigidus]|nr:hypothetical protein T484DRAFT_1813332 [Cryptophyta sp. CCMP2293]